MKRIITLTLSLLLLFGSLSACTQSIETALPKPEKHNWMQNQTIRKKNILSMHRTSILLNLGQKNGS